MNSFTKFSAITFTLILLLFSCDKPDLSKDTGSDELKSAVVKGKPTPQPGYPKASQDTPIQVYGVWHAGNDYCTWGSLRTISEFDSKNHWLIDRGDENASVNLVVLSFVNPLKLLNKTNDATTLNGIPIGMTADIINYFKSSHIRVMLSIGGITYTDAWNTALSTNARKLGVIAATVAETMGVGIEIDYEENTNPNLDSLQSFISGYRSIHSYDASGTNHAARLTIDLAAGDRWLIAICQKATKDWLRTDVPVLDYANAMVPARQPSASDAIANWYEHIVGKQQYAPPIPPLAPCKFTGALYINGSRPIAECVNFDASIQYVDRDFVRRILPYNNTVGTTAGMLGYMFWAAECPSTRALCTTLTNGCTGGVGAGATYFNIPVPMPAMRQN